MNYRDAILAMLSVPLVIALGIALVFISYVIVPAIIALIIGTAVYTVGRSYKEL